MSNYLNEAFQPAESDCTPLHPHPPQVEAPALSTQVPSVPSPELSQVQLHHPHSHPSQDADGNVYHHAGDPVPTQSPLPPHLQYQFGSPAQQNAIREQQQQRFPQHAQLRSPASLVQGSQSQDGQTYQPPPQRPQQPPQQDTTMQGVESDSDSGPDSENENSTPTGDKSGTKPVAVAPLVQPITPLQLPKVRPTLLLGPHETREIAMNAAQEYAIAQGYILVQSGCAKQKTAGGKYLPVAEVVRVDLMCDRGGTCKNTGTGRRKRPTHKLGCPTRMKLVCRKRQASKWFIEIFSEEHNHDLDPANIGKLAGYRRWRRLQAGGPGAEPIAERHARNRKPKVMPPVPPPKFHQVGAVGVQPPSSPTTPLHVAALKGQCKIIGILLDKGADINALDAAGRTPLHCGVEGQRMDAVRLLVDRGADVARLDGKGLSVLHLAVERGLEDAVELFVERGADPNR